MTQAATPFQKAFDSPNGGISMCLESLADRFVEFGIDELRQQMQKKYAGEKYSRARTDWLHLIDGVKRIDETKLKNAIEPLRPLWKQIQTLDDRYQQYTESLELAKNQWRSAAETVKKDIAVLTDWALQTEIKRCAHWPSTSRTNALIHIDLGIKLSAWRHELDSPQEPLLDNPNVKRSIDAFKAIISLLDTEEKNHKNKSLRDLERANKSLDKCLERLNSRSNLVSQTVDEWREVRATYVSMRIALLDLLCGMPEKAHHALFNIYHPEVGLAEV